MGLADLIFTLTIWITYSDIFEKYYIYFTGQAFPFERELYTGSRDLFVLLFLLLLHFIRFCISLFCCFFSLFSCFALVLFLLLNV